MIILKKMLFDNSLCNNIIFRCEVHSRVFFNAGGGIRTHELLRDGVLSPAPLARLGDPRSIDIAK